MTTVGEFLKSYNKEKEKQLAHPKYQICHLVYTPFTGLGRPGFKGDDWYKKRIEIFKENTLKSLQNQTSQFFVHWISFREEEQSNDLTKELFTYLCGINWRVIFTFGGLCWWDDKFKNDKLLERLEDTLPSLKEIVGDAKYVYETVLASDDMYHKDVIEEIENQPFAFKRALVHWNGYIQNLETGQLAEYNPPAGHLPPFYTIMYPADVFLNPKKHFKYICEMISHEDVDRLFDCIRLPDGRYVVNVHGNNLSTSWMGYKHNALEKTKHDFIGEEITDEKEEILINFRLCKK